VVVEGDHHAVPGRVQIGLQVLVPEPDRLLEGAHRVLVADVVRVISAAAMSHRERAVVVQVGIHTGSITEPLGRSLARRWKEPTAGVIR